MYRVVPFVWCLGGRRDNPTTTAMEIYLKYNAESEKYAHLVADALHKAGHGVFTRKHFSIDA